MFGTVPRSLKEIYVYDATNLGSRALEYARGAEFVIVSKTIEYKTTNSDGTINHLGKFYDENGLAYYDMKPLISNEIKEKLLSFESIASGSEAQGLYVEGVSYFGTYCFANMDTIKYAYLEDGTTTTINGEEHTYLDLSQATFGFRDCNSLKEIYLMNAEGLLPHAILYECVSLIRIEVPNTITEIGSYIIGWCPNVTEIILPFYGKQAYTSNDYSSDYHTWEKSFAWIFTDADGVDYNGNYNTGNGYYKGDHPNYVNKAYNSGVLSSIHGHYTALSYTLTLTSPTANHINYHSFYDANGLKEIYIQDTVKFIGNYAFFSCENIKKFSYYDTTLGERHEVNEGDMRFSSNMLFLSYYAFNNVDGIKDIIIPNNVTNIEEEVFYAMDYVERLVTPFIGATRDKPYR